MNQSNNEMSSFLAELADEATEKLAAKQSRQQDHQAMTHSVNAALEQTYKFFHLLVKHLNALEPDVPRVYALDGKSRFPQIKWQSGMAEYRKQSIADNALMNHVYFQVRLACHEPIIVTRRWEQFEETRKELDAYGLKTKEDMHELWRNRAQTVTFQATIEPEFIVWMRFLGNYSDGSIEIESNNLDGFGVMKGKLPPESLQTGVLDEVGRFVMGRSNELPQELKLVRDYSRNP